MLTFWSTFSRQATRGLTAAGLGVALLALQLPVASASTPIGADTVDSDAGVSIGRHALSAFTRSFDTTPQSDPYLDALARDQLRAAITNNADTGTLGPRLVHPTSDILVRIGIVSADTLSPDTDMFALTGPTSALAVGSAGGEAQLKTTAPGAPETFVAQVAATAWREPQAALAADELTATFGVPPQTQDELNAAAAQRWLDQENRDRQTLNFPAALLARRHLVLDREAENTMRRRFGEPVLPAIVDPSGVVALDNKTHFTAYGCAPNCDAFWTAPDRVIDLLRQSSVEDVAALAVAKPQLLDFQRWDGQLGWAVTLQRYPHYWSSYRTFGVATRVHLDQEVTEGRDAARAAVDTIAPGGATLWDPREYKLDIVVIAYDPWPTDWHRRP